MGTATVSSPAGRENHCCILRPSTSLRSIQAGGAFGPDLLTNGTLFDEDKIGGGHRLTPRPDQDRSGPQPRKGMKRTIPGHQAGCAKPSGTISKARPRGTQKRERGGRLLVVYWRYRSMPTIGVRSTRLVELAHATGCDGVTFAPLCRSQKVDPSQCLEEPDETGQIVHALERIRKRLDGLGLRQQHPQCCSATERARRFGARRRATSRGIMPSCASTAGCRAPVARRVAKPEPGGLQRDVEQSGRARSFAAALDARRRGGNAGGVRMPRLLLHDWGMSASSGFTDQSRDSLLRQQGRRMQIKGLVTAETEAQSFLVFQHCYPCLGGPVDVVKCSYSYARFCAFCAAAVTHKVRTRARTGTQPAISRLLRSLEMTRGNGLR